MSNLHSKQTGTQLHNPKKHAEAEIESLLLKTKDNTVGYVGCYNTYSTVITPVADVGGSTNNKYFCLYSKHGSQKYALWYNCNSNGTLTLPSGYDGILEVRLVNGDSVANIITKTIAVLNGLTENYVLFDSLVNNTTSFTIVQTNSPVIEDVTTGYLYATTTTPYSIDKVLVAEGSSKELKFIPLEEKIADTVGAMVSGNTETNVTVTYNDSDNTLDFVAGAGGVSQIIAGNNVTISPSGGTGNVTINAPTNTDTHAHSWTGCINLTEEGRAATAYSFDRICETRYPNNHVLAVGNVGSTIPVTANTIISATKFQITRNGTTNKLWTVKIQATQASTGGFLHLYSGRLVCDGVQPAYAISKLTTLTVPALAQNAFACLQTASGFLTPVAVGDCIIPIWDGQNGANNLHYQSTIEIAVP